MILYFRRESLFNNSDKEKLIDIDADYFKKINDNTAFKSKKKRKITQMGYFNLKYII